VSKNEETLDAMQRLGQTLTMIPSWIHRSSSIAPLAGWRWFIDGAYLVFEPRTGAIQSRDMAFLDLHASITAVEAVFREAPNPGIYLRCKLAPP
jgi:hypothetical protein